MPLVFARGGVAVVLQPDAVGVAVQPFGAADALRADTFQAVLTRMQTQDGVGVQLTPAVGGLTHLVVFGDTPGRLALTGLVLPPACADAGPVVSDGMGGIRRWYQARKASRRDDPVRLTVGGEALDGYLTELQVDSGDPALGFGSWTAALITLPEG